MTAGNGAATDHDGGGVTDGADSMLPPKGQSSATFGECLDALGLHAHELLSLGVKPKGGGFEGFQMTVRELKEFDLAQWAECDVWAGLQPMRPVESGRGSAKDVVQLVAVYADLDIGPGKLPDEEAVGGVIGTLSGMLGSRPTYVTFSGHGYQPVWLVKAENGERSELTDEDLTGWGKLVKQVAKEQGGSADSVFDAARILRVPGTTNWKDPSRPMQTKAWLLGGEPVSAANVRHAVATHAVLASRMKTTFSDAPNASAHTGQPASCSYARSMVDGWRSDEPTERHPWATRNGLKLACLLRLGCIDEKFYSSAVEVLAERMEQLCAREEDARAFDPVEVVGAKSSIVETANAKVAAMNYEEVLGAVGRHRHSPNTTAWTPALVRVPQVEAPHRAQRMPTIHSAAYHGPVGEYVRAIAGDTESDPVAVLAQALAWAGCRVGRRAFVRHGSATHYPAVWPLIVGRTSTGRKGSSEQDSLTALSAHSAQPRRRSGLTSGEGLIDALTEQVESEDASGLLVVESEWEGVTSRTRREGNSLSPVLRDAYDFKPLATMNAGENARSVEGYMLTVVGHITPEAFRQGMGVHEGSGGFLNRFLPLLVHRPRTVSWPADPTEEAKVLLKRIATADFCAGEYRLSAEAKQFYMDWYDAYNFALEGESERVAMGVARAVPNVLRLSLIYASLDPHSENTIALCHMQAAVALVEYSCITVRTLLAPGKAGLDGRVLAALREKGEMTREQLGSHFNRHQSAVDLDNALALLANAGLIEQEKVPTKGRSASVYRAAAR